MIPSLVTDILSRSALVSYSGNCGACLSLAVKGLAVVKNNLAVSILLPCLHGITICLPHTMQIYTLLMPQSQFYHVRNGTNLFNTFSILVANSSSNVIQPCNIFMSLIAGDCNDRIDINSISKVKFYFIFTKVSQWQRRINIVLLIHSSYADALLCNKVQTCCLAIRSIRVFFLYCRWTTQPFCSLDWDFMTCF